jgi:hypothetical protein
MKLLFRMAASAEIECDQGRQLAAVLPLAGLDPD